MELRYLTTRNKVTKQEVEDYRQAKGVNMREAIRILENVERKLQYQTCDGWWLYVPEEIEYREIEE